MADAWAEITLRNFAHVPNLDPLGIILARGTDHFWLSNKIGLGDQFKFGSLPKLTDFGVTGQLIYVRQYDQQNKIPINTRTLSMLSI